MIRRVDLALGWALLLVPAASFAEPAQVPGPGPRDTCPVCGMLVAKHPKWVATVLFRDGHAEQFVGAKQMFEYLLDGSKWAPGRRREEIALIGVTDYAGSTRIDGRKAIYVVGSRVRGPVGDELVPLANEAEAAAFTRDHGGRILRFHEVDAALLARLDSTSPGAVAPAEPVQVPGPGPRDTCPVCGMFVAKYPAWVGTVLLSDQSAHHFDGAKDMFKYLLDMPRWAPGRRKEEVVAIGVTEYYGLTRINARDAWYVVGSDVLGPMGHELVPLASKEDAEGFLRDHKGRRVVRFNEVDAALLSGLDQGRFR